MRTSDGVEITHDLRVWTNDFRRGSVVIDDRNRPHQQAPVSGGSPCSRTARIGPPCPRNHGSRRATPRPPRGPRPSCTKWDLITPQERRALDATAFSDGTKGCSVCHTPLPTEGDFARHYLVPDRRYKNLGGCPTKWDD